MVEANMENHCNKLCSDGRAFPRARAPLFRVTKVLSIYLSIYLKVSPLQILLRVPPTGNIFAFRKLERIPKN